MNTLHRCLTLMGAMSAAAVYAQAPSTMTPPAPTASSMPGMMQMPRMNPGAAPYRFEGALGFQSNYTYFLITSNKDALTLSPDETTKLEQAQKDFFAARGQRQETQRKIQDDLRTLTAAEPIDMGKVESSVNALEKARGDDMLADIKANAAYKQILTQEQRDKLKTLSPQPPRMGAMPGMQGMPGMPGMQRPGMMTPRPMPGGMPMPTQPATPPPPVASSGQ